MCLCRPYKYSKYQHIKNSKISKIEANGGGGERVLDFDQILAYQILAKLKQIRGGWGGGLGL